MLIFKGVGHLAAIAQAKTSRIVGQMPATPVALARQRGIRVEHAEDCNDADLVARLDELDPDILVSVNVYQRMREQLLNVPRLSALNTHFGMLPKYKGMSPVIWALVEGERSIGITVHKMVLEFDEGHVVRQEALPVRSSDSALSLTLRGADRASDLVLDSVLTVGAHPEFGKDQEGPGSYYSLPTKEAIAKLLSRGRKLWRWRDLRNFWHDSPVTGGSHTPNTLSPSR